MAREADPVDFLEREPDERLLDEDLGQLPASVGLPEPVPGTSLARQRVVALGATMTGATLVVGIVLAAFGAVDGIAGSFDLTSVVALIVGIVLVTTHWGWVHVAELTGNSLQRRHNAPLLARRHEWLTAIEPYPRWEVSTSAGEDGSITILTVRHRPVPSGEGRYTFIREHVGGESHPPEEPAAEVAERAESLRRQAAEQTRVARERYEVARDAYERARLTHDDEQERVDALRAASEALSERINSNLREPPLIE